MNISDLLSPAMSNRKDDYHLVRTPGQLLSLTSHLSFRSPSCRSDRGASPTFNTPEILRDRNYTENSFCGGLLESDAEISIGMTPPGQSDSSFAALKRKFNTDDHDEDDEEDEDEEDQENSKPSQRVQFKMPRRSGLTGIFHFASLTEEHSDERY